MNFTDLINKDIKSAMLAREKERLQSLRAIKAALLLAKTEKSGDEEMSDEDVIKMLQRLVKQRVESAKLYIDQGRADLADVENAQAEVIKSYLPEQLDEHELLLIVKSIIDDLGAIGMKDMGRVMGVASKKLAGKADNKTVSTIVKSLLM